MTAVRKLTAIVCSLSAPVLFAQTTSPAPTPTPSSPAATVQVTPAGGATTTPSATPGTTTRSTPSTTNRTLVAPATTMMVPATTTTTAVSGPATTNVSADTDRDLNDPRALRLSLDDAIKTAMERNVGIEVSRYEYRASGEALRSQYGLFDWLGTADVERQSQKDPAISQFQSSGSTNSIANFGIEQTIPTGGTYNVGFTNSKITTIGGGTLVSPAYRSGLAFAAAQPLMRDFGVDITQRGINIARNTLGVSREAFRATLLDTTNSVEQAYLNLVYARQFVDVVKESLFLARDQSRITQIRIDVGASAPLDILQPRVQIATEEENLINAVADVRNAEDVLRTLLHLDPAEWDRPIIPTDPVRYTPVTVNVQEAVSRAFDLRPELRELTLTTDTRRIQNLYARNQTLPQLDLHLNYNAAGLAGRSKILDPETGEPTGNFSSTGYTRAFRQVLGSDFPSWTVAFNVGVPITNIGARAESKRTELELQRAHSDEEQQRENIALEVRQTARAIDTSAKNITAARAAREAAEQNLEAERRRYENGMTTNFQVLQVQQQLSDARARELQALVGYNKAVTAYHRAIGDLLEIRNIRVEDERVNEPKVPRLFSNLERYNWLNYGNRAQTTGTTASPR